ncbi:DnaJ subfamily C member 2 [Heracleum sosnowskyi]|uniref:DnaJ subfamily C member 2 n=1 Tax=Heracleum sosnowskyi TaxID=360622 RepID=A0AAD8GNN4_9APIA|nr:DnaJ subfamily C member 2 [Heracleum sosnowskyi]
MPQRNFKKQDQNATVLRRSPRFLGNNSMIQAEPTSILRRSSRLLAKSRDESDPKTPIQGQKGTMGSFFEASSCISTPKERVKVSKPRNSVASDVLKELNFAKEGFGKGNEGSGRSENLVAGGGGGSSCLRRSSRLSGKENLNSRSRLNFDEFRRENKDLGKKGVQGKKIKVSANFPGKGGLYNQLGANVVIGLAAQSEGETKKTGNSNPGNVRKVGKKCVGNGIDGAAKDLEGEVLDKGASLSVERISKSGLGLSDQETVGATSKAPVKGRAERVARAVVGKQKCIGVKRKRNQVEDGCENHGTISWWTTEQNEALQKAYFATSPTPRFWKEVAKRVPGKSAQDCFNKIHADYQTPRQAQRRSRAKLLNSSPLSYSASKLLDSIGPKSKRPGNTKRKSHVQKTTRQLLQKQCQVNRDQNADIFSLLEPEISPSSNALRQGVNCSTPKQGESNLLRRCQEPSSSARRMQCSRFNSVNETSLESPPVLKPIKNKALHEKYLDQLHAREVKRRAAAARAAKSSLKVLDGKECRVQKNAVESAKNALLLDARDAINQFRHEQANDFSSFPDDGDVLYSDEDINEG